MEYGILRWKIASKVAAIEMWSNKDSNDLFDQLFLLLWIHEWYFPTSFQPRSRAVCQKQATERRQKILKKCMRRQRTHESGCHQRGKSGKAGSRSSSRHGDRVWPPPPPAPFGKMTQAPAWNPWSFHLRGKPSWKETVLLLTLKHTKRMKPDNHWHCIVDHSRDSSDQAIWL